MALNVEATPEGRLLVQHRHFGAQHTFRVGSSVSGVLSPVATNLRLVNNGRDISGTLNGEPAQGLGAILSGQSGNITTTGLVVCYNGLPFTGMADRLPRKRRNILERDVFVGRVIVASNALTMKLEGNPPQILRLRLDSVRPEALAVEEENDSDFSSLGDIRLGSPTRLRDSRRMAATALEQVQEARERLRLIAGDLLFPSLARLRVKAQNLISASPLMTGFGVQGAVAQISEHIRRQGRAALSAQTPPTRQSLVGLLSVDRDETNWWG